MPKPILPFLSPTTTNAVKRKLRPPFTTFATRLTVTTRSSSSILFESMLLRIYRYPPLSIKIQDLLLEQPLLKLLYAHEKGNHRGQILLIYILFLEHVLRPTLQLVWQLLLSSLNQVIALYLQLMLLLKFFLLYHQSTVRRYVYWNETRLNVVVVLYLTMYDEHVHVFFCVLRFC